MTKTDYKAKRKDAKDLSIEQAEFNKYCRQFGFEPVHYRIAISYAGVEYALVGFMPDGRNYTCKLRSRDGQVLKTSAEFVHKHIVGTNI